MKLCKFKKDKIKTNKSNNRSNKKSLGMYTQSHKIYQSTCKDLAHSYFTYRFLRKNNKY